MRLIGLAGPARVGKDTIADYLVEKYNFVKFSFSDALYSEVSRAFGVPVDALMRPDLKEEPTQWLSLRQCSDDAFVDVMERSMAFRMSKYATLADLERDRTAFLDAPRSPRWVLQRWGTEYRRAQDPEYWIKRADAFVKAYLDAVAAGKIENPGGLVNTSVRFDNECSFVRSNNGEVWHVFRREAEDKHLGTYASELRLPIHDSDRVVYNNSTIDRLNTAVSLFVQGAARHIVLEGGHNA